MEEFKKYFNRVFKESGFDIKVDVKGEKINLFERYFNIYDVFEDVLDDRVFVKIFDLSKKCGNRKLYNEILDYLEDVYGDLVWKLRLGGDIIYYYEKFQHWDLDKVNEIGEGLGFDVNRGYVGDREEWVSYDEEEWFRLLEEFNDMRRDLKGFDSLVDNICNEDLLKYLEQFKLEVKFNNSADKGKEWNEKYVDGDLVRLIDMKNEYLKNKFGNK